jgi:hypothetical protein
MKQQLFEDAIEKARQLAANFPEEPFQQDVQAATSARELRDRKKAQLERKEAIARGRAELDALMKQRRFEDAIEKARQLVGSFPEEPFQQDLQAAISARDLRDRRQQVDAEIAELEKMFRQGDAASVRKGAEKLLESYPEPRARELLDWAKKTEQKVRSIKKKADGPRFDWRWIAAVVALPIVLFAAWKLIPKPTTTPPGELHITPTELSFSYRPGDPVVAAQTLQLTGQPAGATWVVRTSDKWFTATPIEPIGDGQITVQVDPRKLEVGEHTGVVTISAKHFAVAEVHVYVRLSIAMAPPPPPPLTLRITPLELLFSYQKGGPLPPDQSMQLTGNPSDETWVTQVSDSWFQANPSQRSGDGPISIHVEPQKLPVGDYSGFVTVSAKNGTVKRVPVKVRLSVLAPEITEGPKPELNVQPRPLLFTYRRGGSAPAALPLQVNVKPAGEAWGATSNIQWIKLNPTERSGDGSILVTVDPQGLPLGDNNGTVIVSSKRSLVAPVQVSVKLTIQDAAPPPPPPPVDCHNPAVYHGASSGSVQWNGILGAGQAVTIGRDNVVLSAPPGAPPAEVKGRTIPGCDISITAGQSGIVADFPGAANGFSSVTLKNTSSGPVNGPKFDWKVK